MKHEISSPNFKIDNFFWHLAVKFRLFIKLFMVGLQLWLLSNFRVTIWPTGPRWSSPSRCPSHPTETFTLRKATLSGSTGSGKCQQTARFRRLQGRIRSATAWITVAPASKMTRWLAGTFYCEGWEDSWAIEPIDPGFDPQLQPKIFWRKRVGIESSKKSKFLKEEETKDKNKFFN